MPSTNFERSCWNCLTDALLVLRTDFATLGTKAIIFKHRPNYCQDRLNTILLIYSILQKYTFKHRPNCCQDRLNTILLIYSILQKYTFKHRPNCCQDRLNTILLIYSILQKFTFKHRPNCCQDRLNTILLIYSILQKYTYKLWQALKPALYMKKQSSRQLHRVQLLLVLNY